MHIFYLIIILLSLVGMIFVVKAKHVEITSGKGGFFSRLSDLADPVLSQYIEKIHFFISKLNAVNIRKVLIVLTHNLFHISGTVGIFVSEHYKKFKSRLNGKKDLHGGGVVSFFLKDVAESKEDRKDL